MQVRVLPGRPIIGARSQFGRVANRNAAVCKTAMSRGSTGQGLQHAFVDQPDGQPCSKRPYAGSSPAERAIIRQFDPGHMTIRLELCRDPHLNFGELAERQGNAVLTRRVLRDAQVRFLYSPPSREGDGRAHRDRSDPARRTVLAERCSGAFLVHCSYSILAGVA